MPSVIETYQLQKKRVESAKKTLDGMQYRIEEFSNSSTAKLLEVLAKFSDEKLLPDIDPKYYFKQIAAGLPPDRIDFRGTLHSSANTIDDIKGGEIAKAIYKAASENKIPVSYGTDHGHHIKILQNVGEENGPETLLRALAEYSESQGKSELAKSTISVADEMHTLSKKVKDLDSSLALV